MDYLSTLEVCDLCKVTPRMLQHWDEQQLITPKHAGHHRRWGQEDVLHVQAVASLRRKGVSLHAIRRYLRPMQRELKRAILRSETVFVIADATSLVVECDRDRVIEILSSAKCLKTLVKLSV